MKFQTTNKKLANFCNLLLTVEAKGKKSRAVAKFLKLTLAKTEELQMFQRELIKQYFEQDENGNAKVDKSGNPLWLDGVDKEAYVKERNELDNELVIIDLTEYTPFVEYLISALDEWENLLSGQDAIAYDELLDKLEALQEEVKVAD